MKQLFSYTCLFPALIALVTVSAQEYKVSGTISGHNGKALEFIEVSLVSADSIAIVSDLTNDKGFFQLKAEKGTYTLLAENLGTVLFTKDIDINADMDLRKIIVENSIELSEAVITMSKPIFKQEYDKFIFNVENSPLKQGYDAMEVLKRSPKIQINSKGNILLRNQSVLVLVNGRKMNMSGEELNNYLSGINSENIKSIEIQDVGSAETDASNSGGVVNIILKKPPTGFQSTVKTFYMHRNERNQVYFSGITNQFGSKKWNIYNRINYREDGNFNEYNSTLKFYENNSRNESEGKSNSKSTIFNTTTGIVFYPNDKHEIGTELYYVNNISDTKLNGNLQIFNPNLYAISTSDATSYFTYKTWDAIVNYTYKLDSLGSKVKLIADIGNNNTGNRNDVGIKYTYGILSDSKSRFLTNANSDFYNAQVDWNQKAKKKWEFNIGTKFYGVIRNNTIDTYYFDNDWQPLPERQEHFENIENIWANYLTFSTKWKETHQLKIGLRTEYTDTRGKDFINNTEVKQNYLDWFPSFFYAYQLKENQNLSFSYSRRITRPTFSDLNPFLIKLNDYSYQMGNSDLRPQYTNKFDITYQLKKQSFSLYGNFSKDLISRVYTVDDNNVSYFQPKNFGKEKEIGLDYSYHSDIFKWLYTNISAGIWHYDFELGELKNNRVAYYISAFTRIKFSKNFFLEIQNNFNSKNSSRVGVFDKQYRMDLALQKNVWNGAGIIRLACEDVFNTERDKNISYYQDFDFRFSQKRITQSVVLMFIYTFKNKGRFNEKIVEQGNENRQRL